MEIKELRKTLKLTQEALSIRLGVSIMTVRRWESGKSVPSRMAQRLIDEFLKGEVKS